MSRSHTLTLAHELRGRQRAHRCCRRSALWLPLTSALVVSMLSRVVGADAYTPAEQAEIEALQDDVTRFEDAAGVYRATVNRLVKGAYEDRRKQVLEQYSDKIIKGEEQERTRRIAAITLFEDFLQRYPNDRRWTPDVIFRLAELYFEKSHDEYLLDQERYEKQLRQTEEQQLAEQPAPPRQDYSRTIALHRRLIREWPEYRLIDGAYYLLGFCLSETGETQMGNQAMLALVCTNSYQPPLEQQTQVAPNELDVKERPGFAYSRSPSGSLLINSSLYNNCKPLREKGRFNAEAWTRVGEHHFDENELGPAIAAYQRVLALGPKDNPYYDEALYKLAWTHYRADKFTESIARFDELVVYADKELARTGKAGSEMRPEAIQYLGISFSEEDWDANQQPDADAGLPRLEKFYDGRHEEKHVFEVYRRLGDIYFDTTKYDQAIQVYKLILERWPYNPEDPDVQDKIILAMERQREFERAIQEREEFSRLFGKGTEWERRNRNNPQALKKARDYDEQALIQAAVHHHKAGQDLRKRGIALKDVELLKKAGEEYAIAAKAYERYLERFPNSKNSYEIRYSYASCLFFSQRFPEAAKAYAAVRDSNLDNRFQEDAAFSATKAYEEHIKRMMADGKLSQPELPTSKSTANQPMVLPEEFKQWQGSLDMYAKLLPQSPKTPRLSYKAAEVSYRFIHFEDARKRFVVLYDKYCADSMSINAGQAILVTYQLEKNLDAMQDWATKLSSGKCGGSAAGGKVRAGAKQLLVGIKFKRAETAFQKAEKLYAAGKKQEAAPVYDKAAGAYLALVESNPQSGDADKALFNAGVAYEKSMRYESATKIYERVWQKYPKSPLAHEALWRSAENYKRFFEFKKAVNNYLIMADAPRFAESSHRVDAIYNAAVILENDQDYSRSAKLFLRYADQVGKPKEAAEAYFRAGVIYGKMKDFTRMTKVFRDFPKRYGSLPGQETRVVEAFFRIGKTAEDRKQTALARRYYLMTINEFNRRGLAPASDAAEYAANADFQLLETKLSAFLKTNAKAKALNTLVGKKKKLEKQAIALRKEYDELLRYKRARWTLAAMYRRGVIFEHVARSVAEGFRGLAVPKRVKRLGQEAVDIYMEQLDQALEREVRPLEEETKKLYAVAVERAEQLGVSNRYTEEARRRLNALDPGAYPLLKAPMVDVAIE